MIQSQKRYWNLQYPREDHILHHYKRSNEIDSFASLLDRVRFGLPKGISFEFHGPFHQCVQSRGTHNGALMSSITHQQSTIGNDHASVPREIGL
jgi:hypothetical protein